MSGGYWDYMQDKLKHAAVDIETEMDRHEWEPQTIARFNNAIFAFRIAAVYMERVDWLLSSDDGEDDFIRRLDEQLGKIPWQLSNDGKG